MGRQGRRGGIGRMAGQASAQRAMKALPEMWPRPTGAIGYVEYAYAAQNNLPYTKMINRDGKMVSPDYGIFPGGVRQAPTGTMPTIST